jgi:hypothetical protein
MSRKSAEPKTGPSLTAAAERTGLLIRGLQARLADQAPEETTEDLERELQQYFAARAEPELSNRFPLDQIRQRVIEGVAERILSGWDRSPDGKVATLEDEVVERLIERIFECLLASRRELPRAPKRSVSADSANNSAKLAAGPLSTATLPA